MKNRFISIGVNLRNGMVLSSGSYFISSLLIITPPQLLYKINDYIKSTIVYQRSPLKASLINFYKPWESRAQEGSKRGLKEALLYEAKT